MQAYVGGHVDDASGGGLLKARQKQVCQQEVAEVIGLELQLKAILVGYQQLAARFATLLTVAQAHGARGAPQ